MHCILTLWTLNCFISRYINMKAIRNKRMIHVIRHSLPPQTYVQYNGTLVTYWLESSRGYWLRSSCRQILIPCKPSNVLPICTSIIKLVKCRQLWCNSEEHFQTGMGMKCWRSRPRRWLHQRRRDWDIGMSEMRRTDYNSTIIFHVHYLLTC